MADVEKIPLNIENVFFFEQTRLRKFLKEQKTIQDLQSEISSSTVQSQLVRSQKIKKQLTIPAFEEMLDEDTVRSSSPLKSTDTSKTVASPYSNIDEQANHFPRLKFLVSHLLDEINGMILHCQIDEIPFPQGLENILNYGWKDFIKDVTYIKRGWPTATCKYACLQRPFSHRSALSKISVQSIINDIDKNISKTQTPVGEVSARGNRKLFGATPVKGKKKDKRKQVKAESSKGPHPTGFTINFSISSKTSMKQGWIIEPYDDTLAKVDWKTIYTLMLEKIQAANSKIKLQRMSMAKHGFDKPVILLHYEEARTVPLGKYWKQVSAPAFALKDGKPPIPVMKVENPALNKLHYALNDGSCIIYYPSGNIAVCRSHSGLSCPGAFYTNIFDDSAVRPTLLGSFTPFGNGSIFLPGEKSRVLLYHEEGGLLINENEISMKHWKWPKRGNLPEPIWVQVNDYIIVRINGRFSINFTYKWQYEYIRFPLSPLPDVIPPQPNKMYKRKQSSLHRPVDFTGVTQKVSNITIQSLRQLHRRIKTIIDNWMEHYRKETGLSKFSQAVEPDLQHRKSLPALDPLKIPAALKKHFPDSTSYVRFLTTPTVDKIICVPQSCTFTSNWPLPISREDSFAVLLASRRGSFTGTTVKHSSTLCNSFIVPASEQLADGETPQYYKFLMYSRVLRSLDVCVSGTVAAFVDTVEAAVTSRAAILPETVAMQKLKEEAAKVKTIHCWSDQSDSMLQDCFDDIDWNVFLDEDVSKFTEGVTCFIQKCNNGVVPQKLVGNPGSTVRLQFPKVHKEEKPWLQSPGSCPVALRSAMLGEGLKPCKCSVNKVPHITDLEFDTFIERATAEIRQIVLVCVVSSHSQPMPCESMIQELYEERNRNRSQPCAQSRLDSFRILKYDINTANDHTGQRSALLIERHNVTPGMFLMYIGGKLLFADHIFNGYSATVKDLKKQLAKTYEDYLTGHQLLHDFRFSSFHYNQSGTELDNGIWISQMERPKSEASMLPSTCIFPTSDRAATIQNFIAFSLSQRSGCCSSMLY
ncbi:uncharacterized protein [Hemitrygon akajei]|uniref:uncharacterized protein n=1 Tax=Hemitrygon akajei TaxID=2704970 RepID=UPI003BF9CA97